ncbi:MAG: OmpA family protein [Myxococcales bacterium]|nr:OmpA family protein [Myxococcales bacterium]
MPAEAGCPPPPVAAAPEAPADRDTDGLPDLADQCPLLAEDHDGYRDDDGCPDPDNDLDLLADGFDADPLAPEDWDDFEDADGRPDLDNDRDGLADDRDPAPPGRAALTAAPRASPPPSASPAPTAPTPRSCSAAPCTPPARSRSPAPRSPPKPPRSSTASPPTSPPTPSSTVEIGVHTDGRGSAPRKRALARARAAAVRAALVTRGVDPARLFTRGYGPDVPVDTDQTAAGRANNRRVELRALMPFEATPTEPRRPEERRARPRAATPEAQPRASRSPAMTRLTLALLALALPCSPPRNPARRRPDPHRPPRRQPAPPRSTTRGRSSRPPIRPAAATAAPAG